MRVSGYVAVAVAFAAVCGSAFAAPSISGVSGDATHGSSITVTGSGFGAKASAGPLKWDDFENGTNGATLESVDPSWHAYSRGGGVYNNSTAHSGALAAYNDPFQIGQFATNYFYYPPTDEVFVSYWVNITNADVTDYAVIKLTRITSSPAAGGGGVYNGTGDSDYTNINPRYGSSGYTACNPGGGLPVNPLGYLNLQYDTWLRVDMYKKLSTPPGQANGMFDVTTVGIDSEIHHDIVTRAAGETFQQDAIILGLMAANVEGQFELHIDDVYLDNTRARVEIGNAATWAACTHKEMQIPSAWSSGSITVTFNQGSFANGASVWLYVVDADGGAGAGYPITIGGPVPHHLSVTNGTGSGDYAEGQVVAISANPPSSGKAFAGWMGDFAYVADRESSQTTVTMPARDVSLTPAYVWVYRLTVDGGSGGGEYPAGRVVNVEADPATSGMEFAGWTGDVSRLSDAAAPSTTLTMPSAVVTVTATYRDIPHAQAGDLNGDGFVGQADLDIVLSQWGRGGDFGGPLTDPRADASGDGFVGQADLDIVLAHWGQGSHP
jgi:hypothetical protein